MYIIILYTHRFRHIMFKSIKLHNIVLSEKVDPERLIMIMIELIISTPWQRVTHLGVGLRLESVLYIHQNAVPKRNGEFLEILKHLLRIF